MRLSVRLLLAGRPFSGLGLRDGRLLLSEAPGLGVSPSTADPPEGGPVGL